MKDLSKDYKLMNGADLAYIGDAYYELKIREYLLSLGITKNKELKQMSVLFVSATAHHIIIHKMMDELTQDELSIYKRGRNNAPKNRRKNLDYNEYLSSTGFEAVIGYLYLKQDYIRLAELINKSIDIIKEYQNEHK